MTELPIRITAGPHHAIEFPLRDNISGLSVDPTQPLIWRRVAPLAPDFELRQGETVFGEMEPASKIDMDAAGECLGRALELRIETGLLKGVRVESGVPDTNEEGPAFRGLLCGWGRVTTRGEVLQWRHALSRVYDHLLIDSRGEELLRLRPAFLRFARTETRVILSPTGWGRPDLAELLLLTWFLRAHAEARGRRIFKRAHKGVERDFP